MAIKFGNLLTTLRKGASVSGQRLAQHLGVSSTYVSQIEKSKNLPPNYSVCMEIANCLRLNKEDKQRLLSLAVLERSYKNNEEFFEALGEPVFDTVDFTKIPVVGMPDKPLEFPLPEGSVMGSYCAKVKKTSPTLFIVDKLPVGHLKGFAGKHDVLVFDANDKDYKDGDYVLVKETDFTGLKRINLYNNDELVLLTPGHKNSVHQSNELKDHAIILGKLVASVKHH